MPIIVYFMKRDLFILWCTHFIFFKNSTDNLNLAENFYFDNKQIATFEKTSWLL